MGTDPRNHDINLKISFFISTYYETLLSYTFEGIFNNRYNQVASATPWYYYLWPPEKWLCFKEPIVSSSLRLQLMNASTANFLTEQLRLRNILLSKRRYDPK